MKNLLGGGTTTTLDSGHHSQLVSYSSDMVLGDTEWSQLRHEHYL